MIHALYSICFVCVWGGDYCDQLFLLVLEHYPGSGIILLPIRRIYPEPGPPINPYLSSHLYFFMCSRSCCIDAFFIPSKRLKGWHKKKIIRIMPQQRGQCLKIYQKRYCNVLQSRFLLLYLLAQIFTYFFFWEDITCAAELLFELHR